MIHVRFEGRSYDIREDHLGMAGLQSDLEIRTCLANHFDVDQSRLDEYVVDRRPNGEVIVRPEAVYG